MGFHGILGILNLVVSIWYLVSPSHTLVHAVIVVTEVMAFSAVEMVSQAPLMSHIFDMKWKISAPHREAFARTITMLHYSSARLAINEYADALLMYKIYIRAAHYIFIYCFLLPTDNFDNWNTWFFGIPMFLGTVIDTTFLDINQVVITQEFLVRLILFANIISFAFTLAFRKNLDINKVYVASVLGVLGVFMTIVPSLLIAAM